MAQEPKPRVFLDSNVIFSGLYSPDGAPGIILEHFLRRDIRVIVSRQVLEEVVRTIKEKLPWVLPSLRRLLVNSPPDVVADPELAEIEHFIGKLSLGDATILGAALAAKPDYFVTGDNHFLRNLDLAEETGLRIVTPAQFLRLSKLEK